MFSCFHDTLLALEGEDLYICDDCERRFRVAPIDRDGGVDA